MSWDEATEAMAATLITANATAPTNRMILAMMQTFKMLDLSSFYANR